MNEEMMFCHEFAIFEAHFHVCPENLRVPPSSVFRVGDRVDVSTPYRSDCDHHTLKSKNGKN